MFILLLDFCVLQNDVLQDPPHKIFDFSGTPVHFIDLQRMNRLQIDAAILTGGEYTPRNVNIFRGPPFIS